MKVGAIDIDRRQYFAILGGIISLTKTYLSIPTFELKKYYAGVV